VSDAERLAGADALHVVVVADTHLKREWPNRRLPGEVLDAVAAADLVLHAGDITQPEHLAELAELAPVHAVLGNNDPELDGVLPETLRLELAGVPIGMIHDSGPARGRAGRLHHRFPDVEVVVFGHSHIPWDEPGIDGQRLFNPGSPTERRRQPVRSYGILDLRDGEVAAARIVSLGP
jgi:putative phosphoesterase